MNLSTEIRRLVTIEGKSVDNVRSHIVGGEKTTQSIGWRHRANAWTTDATTLSRYDCRSFTYLLMMSVSVLYYRSANSFDRDRSGNGS